MTAPAQTDTGDKEEKAVQGGTSQSSTPMDALESQKIVLDLIRKALYAGGYKPRPAKNGMLKEIGWHLWMSNVLVSWSEHFVKEVGLGLRPCPAISQSPTEAEKEALLMWFQMDQKAKTIIQQGLSIEHKKLIQGATTAHGMYEKLARNFAKDAQLSAAIALSEVCGHKWAPQSSTFDENLQYLQSQIEDLRQHEGTKDELIDLIHSVAILNSLPPEWELESVRSAIFNRDKIELDNVIFTARQLEHQARAKTKGKAKKGKASVRPVTCENCKKPGHTKASCWAKGGGNEGGGPKNNKFGNGPGSSTSDAGKSEKKRKSAYTITADDDDDDDDLSHW